MSIWMSSKCVPPATASSPLKKGTVPLSGLTFAWQSAASERDSPLFQRAARRKVAYAAVLMLCWNVAVGQAFGQYLPQPTQPGNAAVVAPPGNDSSVSLTHGWNWWPGLEWSPEKPSLQVEADCFVDAEIEVVFPHLSSVLSAPVQLGDGGPTKQLEVRNTRLNATVSPFIELGGFGFGPGYGELAVNYRILATVGNDDFLGNGANASYSVRSTLNLQTFAFDYIRKDCPVLDDLMLSWDVGVRVQVVYFDTQVQSAGTFEQARNYFFGAGPHLGLGLSETLLHGFSLYGHADVALIGGYNTAQNFVLATNDPASGVLSGSAQQEHSQLSPTLGFQVGLAWSPDALPATQFRAGYQFDQWYNVGKVDASHGNLNAQGLLLSIVLGF
jgi:Legionella pneumophila major outer membrane protein precursor